MRLDEHAVWDRAKEEGERLLHHKKADLIVEVALPREIEIHITVLPRHEYKTLTNKIDEHERIDLERFTRILYEKHGCKNLVAYERRTSLPGGIGPDLQTAREQKYWSPSDDPIMKETLDKLLILLEASKLIRCGTDPKIPHPADLKRPHSY